MPRKLLGHRLAKDTLILWGVQISGYVLPHYVFFLDRVPGPANFWPNGSGDSGRPLPLQEQGKLGFGNRNFSTNCRAISGRVLTSRCV